MALILRFRSICPAVLCFLLPAAAWSAQRTQYRIDASVDYELLTFVATADIRVPGAPDDPLGDLVFFIYANHDGILSDERRKNITVDLVSVDGKAPVPFTLEGPILRVRLPESRRTPLGLRVQYHGIVPRQPAGPGTGGLSSLLGASGTDLGSLLGLPASSAGKSRNNDYGLYAYGNGILSLGSFWYPQLAVRRNGRWVDSVPEGVGDLAFSELSDFVVNLTVPDEVLLATSGQDEGSEGRTPPTKNGKVVSYSARGVRDFAVLASEDYVQRRATCEIEGRRVVIDGYALRKNEGRLARAVDIAGNALQAFSRRFGPYPYERFAVAEGPLLGGAGGMEYSGLTSVASMLFQDWDSAIRAAFGPQGLGSLNQLLSALTGGTPHHDTDRGRGTPAEGRPGSDFLTSLLGGQMEMLESMLEMTIAHEVAHQWWAISVGSDSSRHPFVDESLTNYSAVLYFEDRYGKEAAARMTDLHLKAAYATGRMLAGRDAPANLPTASYAGNLQYAAVIYGKGALYYDALRRAVGDRVFFESLREYFTKFSGRIAGPRDLLAIVQQKAPDAAAETIYRRWIEEAHGDEDIGAGNLPGIGDVLQQLLSPGSKHKQP